MTRETPAPTKTAKVLVFTASRILGGTGGWVKLIHQAQFTSIGI